MEAACCLAAHSTAHAHKPTSLPSQMLLQNYSCSCTNTRKVHTLVKHSNEELAHLVQLSSENPPPTFTDNNFPNIDRQMMRGRRLLVVTLTLRTCLERNKRAPKKIAAVAAVWRKQLRFSQQYAGAGEIGTRLAEKGTDFCLSKTSL